MKKKIINVCFFLSVFIVFMLNVLTLSVSVAEGEAEETQKHETINVEEATYYFSNYIKWKYQFSDDYFFLPSDKYNHSFAKVSAGLAFSASRINDKEGNQGECLKKFLQDIGFKDIDVHTYDTKATDDSIACGIAHKKVDDVTVFCLVVCGHNYGPEWASNVKIGDALLSEGFGEAAGKVQKELDTYLAKYPAEGKAKIWFAGYSRGGAVADIVAANCTDSGKFQDVYAYTFAAPRHTREPGNYRNIFNIIRQEDVVPKVPPMEWGYQRYGVDMTIISPDTDIDCAEFMKRSAELHQEIISTEMTINPDINYHLRCIFDYLIYVLPDSASYTRLLQPVFVDLIKSDEKIEASLETFSEALSRFSAESKEQEAELDELLDYLETLVHVYAFQGRINSLPAHMWDPTVGSYNWFSDHLPIKYLANLYATENPDELFTDNLKYIRLVIGGDVDAEIYDGDTLLRTVNPKEIQAAADSREEAFIYPRVQCKGSKMVINLPANRSYRIQVRSRSLLPQILTYSGNLYSVSSVRAKTDPFYFTYLGYGNTANIVTGGEDRVINQEESDFNWLSEVLGKRYSPSVALSIEEEKVIHLTINGVVTFLSYLMVFLAIQTIASVILAFLRRKKGKERNTLVMAIWHGINVTIFVFCELAMWYFIPTKAHLKQIPMILALLILLVFAWKLYRKNKSPETFRSFLLYAAALVLFGVLNAFFAGGFNEVKTVILILLYSIFFAVPLILFKRQKALGEQRQINR